MRNLFGIVVALVTNGDHKFLIYEIGVLYRGGNLQLAIVGVIVLHHHIGHHNRMLAERHLGNCNE